jgi:hypothetical protein
MNVLPKIVGDEKYLGWDPTSSSVGCINCEPRGMVENSISFGTLPKNEYILLSC